MTTGDNAGGEFALFCINTTGSFFQFISDGVASVTANDVLVDLRGLTAFTFIDLAGGDLTLFA